jgi:DNA-binding NtrC family response regulator/predicted hydrocarbon binding protein
MRPTKFSSRVFQELPPNLSHYVESDRNIWVEGNPKRGRLVLLNRTGNFSDLESLAVERRHLIKMMGHEQARAFKYKSGFEQGRRDARRHMAEYGENYRLALQTALVQGQLQGKFSAETLEFDFNLEERTLQRVIELHSSAEAHVHSMSISESQECVCWETSGYFAGHVSEILGLKAVTVEEQCVSQGHETCKLKTKLAHEFDGESHWQLNALELDSFQRQLENKAELIEQAQKAARKAQASLGGLSKRLRGDKAVDTIIADAAAMQPVMNRAKQLMNNQVPVLLIGEQGTGKSVLAKSIHFGGTSKKTPFLMLDSKGLPENMINQELFGYVPGAFTGALNEYKGLIAKAHGGSVYINDVAALTLKQQLALVDIIETNSYRPMGGKKSKKADVRIIAGINTSPEKAMKRGLLREELFYALSVGKIEVPPLRNRESDILRMAQSFLTEFQQRHNRSPMVMSPEFSQALTKSSWPGNIRQLRNVMEHAVILCPGKTISPKEMPEEILATRWSKQPQPLTEEVILATLSKTNNNRSQAADLLGVGRTTLWRAMKKLGLD